MIRVFSFFAELFFKKSSFFKKSAGIGRLAKTRKTSKGVLTRAAAPVNHAVRAVANTANLAIATAGKLLKGTVKGARKLGAIVVKHVNGTVKNVASKKAQKGGRRRRGKRGSRRK